MSGERLGTAVGAALARLADGIIPPDERDQGASSVLAGERLAARIEEGWNVEVYRRGLAMAEELARTSFGCGVHELDSTQVHDLLGIVRERDLAFFRQLRADVCVFYLSDPAVWGRIGFPGPSTSSGGYPDFDRPHS